MQLFFILLLLQMWRDAFSSQFETCSGLPDVPHASVTEGTKKAEYREGDVIHFICEIGYVTGPTIRHVCRAGNWLAIHQGKCYLKPCELPDNIPYGYYEIIHGEDFVFGATIKYFCYEGYQMISRKDTRTCLLDNWTNHVPICEPLSCELPPASGRVTVNGIPENDDPIIPGGFLTFSCDDPATYLNGSSPVVCGKDGQWDKPFPSCEAPLGCGPPPPLEDGDLRLPLRIYHQHGEKVEYICQNLYTMAAASYKTCINGEWMGTVRCLKPCTVDIAIMREHNIKFRHRAENKLYGPHNDVMEFTCVGHTRPHGAFNFRQRCVDGVIHLPTCL